MFGVKNDFNSAGHASDYYAGLADGIRMFAWMRDGVTHVGTTGTTLAEALDQLDAERQRVITEIVSVAPENQSLAARLDQGEGPTNVANGINPDYCPDDDGVSLRQMAKIILAAPHDESGEGYPVHYNDHVAGALLNAINDVDAAPLGEAVAPEKAPKPKKEKKGK